MTKEELIDFVDLQGEAIRYKNHIEALEAALREIADPGDGYTHGDGHARCQEIARAALDKDAGK